MFQRLQPLAVQGKKNELMHGRILIVDDNQAVRKILRSLLSTHSEFEVSGEAVDGIDAIEKARSLRPDIILMDISMPHMNGIEATKVIRRELPDTKIVIVSQNDPEIVRMQVREAGAEAFVPKGDLSRDLLSTLDGMMRQPIDEVKLDWLAGGGTLGEMIRDHDWSKTDLGPLDHWPQSLKTSVNLILNSQHPMWIGWGPEATFLYNDAYIQVLSLAKHPDALGKPAAEVWHEIWDICGPLADKVFKQGKASFVDGVRLLMNRGDFVEETYYSFSYSPIRDEAGNVAGLFCPSTEVTPKVINARRLGTLAELSADAVIQKTTEAACASVAATLSKNRDDIPFAVLYLIDSDSKQARLEQACGLPKGIFSLTPLAVDLAKISNDQQFLWPLAQVIGSGQSQIVSVKDVEGLPLGIRQQHISKAMVLPVTSRG